MIFRYIYITFVLIVLFSCQKEVDQFIPFEVEITEDVVLDLSQDFASLIDTLTFQMDQSTQTIITPLGAEFTINTDLFEFEDGSSCNCINVDVIMLELHDKKDFLVHQKPTISDDRILVSGGAYYIAAFENGKKLKLKPGKKLRFKIPAETLQEGMELFYGSEKEGRFNWVEADQIPGSSTQVRNSEWQNSTGFFLGYECFSDRLEWINCDKIISDGPPNPVCATVPTGFDQSNTVVFAILKDANSIISMYYQADQKGFCAANIPEGTKVVIVAVHKMAEDSYQFASMDTKIEKDSSLALNFTNLDNSEIKKLLEAL